MRLLLEFRLEDAAHAASQPSLASVAAVLYMGTLHKDRYRKRTDVEGDPHTHHPLSGGWSNRLRIVCSLFGLRVSPSAL